MRFAKSTLVLLLLVLTSSVQAGTNQKPVGVGNGLEPVAGVPYADGMHLVVGRTGGRDYVYASSSSGISGATPGAIRVFDVTNPGRPKLVATIPCGGNQAFLQISNDGKTLLVGEGVEHAADPCMPAGQRGFYTIDISNPRRPKPLGFGISAGGGHTLTAHPTKPFVYMSYGAMVPDVGVAQFEVWSIANPAKPKHVADVPVTGVHGPHDIAFTADGTRAVASSMTLIQVLDTTDPAAPKELDVLQCPGCSHNHEAHFTPDMEHVVVSDETSGGLASPCPAGGLYFYAWDPEGDPYMELVGEWQPAEFVTPEGARTNAGLCTSHVFDVSDDGTKIAASWHTAGVRVVDISEMAGVAIGSEGTGASEIGWFTPQGADSWSAQFDRSGRYVFVNDANSGFQVYRLTPQS